VFWAFDSAWLREMGETAGLQVTVTLLPEGTRWILTPVPAARGLHLGRRVQAHGPAAGRVDREDRRLTRIHPGAFVAGSDPVLARPGQR